MQRLCGQGARKPHIGVLSFLLGLCFFAGSTLAFGQFQSGSPWPKLSANNQNAGVGGAAIDSAQQKWAFQTNSYVNSSPAIGSDGTIYVGSFDHSLYAIDGATGAKKWTFATQGGVNAGPAIGADGTTVATTVKLTASFGGSSEQANISLTP